MSEEIEISIEQVTAEWKEDSKINEAELIYEMCRTPSLHSKYLDYFMYFKDKYVKANTVYYKMGNIKRRYYKGECTQEELQKFGWKQFQGIKPSNTELKDYLDFDRQMIQLKEDREYYSLAANTVERILDSIKGRDYNLKAIVEYTKFISGM